MSRYRGRGKGRLGPTWRENDERKEGSDMFFEGKVLLRTVKRKGKGEKTETLST